MGLKCGMGMGGCGWVGSFKHSINLTSEQGEPEEQPDSLN